MIDVTSYDSFPSHILRSAYSNEIRIINRTSDANSDSQALHRHPAFSANARTKQQFIRMVSIWNVDS